MQELLKESAIQFFGEPVNSPKDCQKLSQQIMERTGRKISPTTLRRFFGLLPSSSAFSTYVLDTLAIYCGSDDFHSYSLQQQSPDDSSELDRIEAIDEINQITEYTLSGIFRKSLTDFKHTIPRKEFNNQLDIFLESPSCLFPVIAPGGYGKSIALAHWVRAQQKRHLCLFCPASIFSSLLDPKVHSFKTLQFRLSSAGDLSDLFLQNSKPDAEKKLLFIIDGLDELSPDTEKFQAVIEFLLDAAARFSAGQKLKIVFSVRESVWRTHLALRFERNHSANRIEGLGSLPESGHTNLLTLSSSEIREILSKVNSSAETPFIYENIPWNIRELIRIPINLHYMSVLFRRESSKLHISQNFVLREFMKETVFRADYAEQKEDLLWKILELTEKYREDVYVQKAELKNHYPIHLKREKAYYQAYDGLLQHGILLEHREENKFGIYTSLVGFRHLNFYYYLSALYQIKINKGLDFGLMMKICNAGKDQAFVSNLLASFYQIAYENEDYETLEHFCELPETILGSLEVRLAVGNSFRHNNSIRDRIIGLFASDQLGRIFFFERFVDINGLFNNFRFRIEEYLKHVSSNENRLFGHSILYLAGFLQLDISVCRHQYSIVKGIPTHKNVHPWPIGRKVSCMLLQSFFIEQQELADLEGLISKYTREAYKYPDYLEKGLVEFELYIMLALVLLQKFEDLDSLLTHVLTYYRTSDPDLEASLMLRVNQNSIPVYFHEYALYKLGQNKHSELPEIWEAAIDSFTATFDDYQYLIMLHWFLCDYYTEKKKPEKAMKHFSAALDLSRYASYDFYEAFLLKNDPSGNKDHIAEADQMIARSGFNEALFDFKFGSVN